MTSGGYIFGSVDIRVEKDVRNPCVKVTSLPSVSKFELPHRIRKIFKNKTNVSVK